MKQRNVVAVILLPLVTLGIYLIYWFVKTKGELNQRGAQIPTSWLLIVPFANLYWMWKYFEAADQVIGNHDTAVLNFVLAIFVTPLIPMAICQDAYNKIPSPTPTGPVGADGSVTPPVPPAPPATGPGA